VSAGYPLSARSSTMPVPKSQASCARVAQWRLNVLHTNVSPPPPPSDTRTYTCTLPIRQLPCHGDDQGQEHRRVPVHQELGYRGTPEAAPREAALQVRAGHVRTVVPVCTPVHLSRMHSSLSVRGEGGGSAVWVLLLVHLCKPPCPGHEHCTPCSSTPQRLPPLNHPSPRAYIVVLL
jgi:hypothetical protein